MINILAVWHCKVFFLLICELLWNIQSRNAVSLNAVLQGQRDNRGDLKDEIERERRRRRSRSRERRPRSGDRDRERSVTVISSVADPDPGSGAFLTPGSRIPNPYF